MAINFTDSPSNGATITANGKTYTYESSSAKWKATAAGAITVEDEGSALSTAASTINFVGSGVVASGSGTTKTITVSGGGGGAAAGNTTTATASGALANGDIVIVNANGTVSAITSTSAVDAVAAVDAVSSALGSETVFDDSTVNDGSHPSGIFDSYNNKVVVAYRDGGDGNKGKVAVGTVSGNSISFGSQVVFNTRATSEPLLTFDSNSNKVVIIYEDLASQFINPYTYATKRITAIVGTVSGTSISFGSPVIIEETTPDSAPTGASGMGYRAGITFDSYNNKVVFSYVYTGGTYASSINDGNHAAIRVGTVSGTSISFGSRVTYNGTKGCDNGGSLTFDSNSNKVVLLFKDGNNSDSSRTAKAMVGTVSGTSISFGTAVEVVNNGINAPAIAFDSNVNKVVALYSKHPNAIGAARVGTVSGTSISFGTETAALTTSAMYDNAVTFDSNANKIILSYLDVANSWYGTLRECTISGTSLTLGSAEVYNSGESDNTYGSTFDSNSNKVILIYRDRGNSHRKTAVVRQSTVAAVSGVDASAAGTSLTAENYIGISNGAYANTATATIQLAGSVDDAQSGLTPGQSYYIQNNGTLSTTADSPLVFAGTAIAATKLIVKGWAASEGGGAPAANTTIASASGALANGDMVVVNSDGTVSTVASTGTAAGTGSPAIFENSTTTISRATFDSNSNKVVVAYLNEYNKGTAVVGTVSGTSISFGTPVIFNNAEVSYITATFDSNANKVVIGYKDNGNSSRGTAIVGTVSGTTISFGSEVVFEYANTTELTSTFDSNLNKVVFAYRDNGNNGYGTAIVGTVSGTSISFGSVNVYYSGINLRTALTFDSTNNKVILAYRAHSNSDHGRAQVGTISGTSISFGSYATFNTASIEDNNVVYDSSNNKVVVAYRDGGNSNRGTAIVGTVSGTSISFGSEAVFNTVNTPYISAHFASNINKVVIGYKGAGGSTNASAIAGTVSGTSISFGTPVTFATTNVLDIGSTYDSNEGKSVFPYTDYTDSVQGKAVALQAAGASSTNLTATNYIGISNGVYADTATATIQVVGSIDDAQSGLTAGQPYYVQTNGTLSTTPGTPSVLAGTAIAATKLIVKG